MERRRGDERRGEGEKRTKGDGGGDEERIRGMGGEEVEGRGGGDEERKRGEVEER